MVLLYMVTFTMNIPQMLAYIPAPWILRVMIHCLCRLKEWWTRLRMSTAIILQSIRCWLLALAHSTLCQDKRGSGLPWKPILHNAQGYCSPKWVNLAAGVDVVLDLGTRFFLVWFCVAWNVRTVVTKHPLFDSPRNHRYCLFRVVGFTFWHVHWPVCESNWHRRLPPIRFHQTESHRKKWVIMSSYPSWI